MRKITSTEAFETKELFVIYLNPKIKDIDSLAINFTDNFVIIKYDSKDYTCEHAYLIPTHKLDIDNYNLDKSESGFQLILKKIESVNKIQSYIKNLVYVVQ